MAGLLLVWQEAQLVVSTAAWLKAAPFQLPVV